MKKIISIIHQTLAVILITCIGISASYAGTLFSIVDKNIVNSNQTITLTVQYDQRVDSSKLNLDGLKKDFEILSVTPHSSSSTSIVNGNVSRETITKWKITLATKRRGQLTIPSFSVNGDLSQEITIESKDGNAQNSDQTLKMIISADNDSVYENEQLLITVEVYAQQGLSRLSLNQIDTDDEIIELSQDTEQRIENGIIRDIYTNRYVIFPTKPGKIKIPSTSITAIKGGRRSVFGSSGGEQVIARSEPFEVTVKPVDSTHSPWFPAQEVIIDAKWSGDTNAIIAGEPITRTLTVSALGKEGSSIPPLKITTPSNIKTYKDQPVINDKRTYKGFIGQRTESEAIVFSNPGKFTLPAVTMRWWNTKVEAWQEAVAPEQVITVLPGSGATKKPSNIITPPTTPITNNGTNLVEASYKTHWLWPLISGLLFMLCLIQAFFLWKLKSAGSPKESYQSQHNNLSEKNAWLHLQQVIKNNNLIETRQALHNWAQTLSSDNKPQSINQLANYMSDNEAKLKLSSTITELESCLYKEQGSFDNSSLHEQLLDLRKSFQSSNSSDASTSTLAPLYKN